LRPRGAGRALVWLGIAAVALVAAPAPGAEMRLVPGGELAPFYPVEGEGAIEVEGFWLDERPVTNAEFLAFVRENPRWRRSRIPELFADSAYLSHWSGDLELGDEALPDQPATFVSWFAAAAYCRSQGARLPSEAEWEWAARPATEEEDAEIRERVLAFYGRPRQVLPPAGASPPNRHELRDLHGVIWEWVSDFQASLVTSDSRLEVDRELERFCGGGALAADDVRDYAAFMRFAFRSSLEARFALHHLGFRCARSVP